MTDTAAPVPELVDVVADAAREAILRLRAAHTEDFCIYALVASGEAYRPHLAATVRGDGQWDLAEDPDAIVEDDILARTEEAFEGRGQLHEMSDPAAETEYVRRLASLEAALRRLDQEGMFGIGDERSRVLLVVATMPPDESDAGFARRLNLSGPLLDALWSGSRWSSAVSFVVMVWR
ncbi:DUF4303 domain-containing protein [Leucobacter allii]|uniref:DUF4303 domain-containing protein n=1 Tax=Leucobacter allii TaxID=2932247 RepID=A0ABY4FR40_9MICO|nr:DUF4303 domain-containing protein [Leucobacter allii]UOQ58760.1 DUF4303 domain-containing protein [Leucobacter allii]